MTYEAGLLVFGSSLFICCDPPFSLYFYSVV